MQVEFNSKVHPKASLGDLASGIGIEPLPSMLDKYNNHTHAIASTGNAYSMGVRIGDTVESVSNPGLFITGTHVLEITVSGTKLVLSQPVTQTSQGIRIQINSDWFLDNCNVTAGSTEVVLQPQHGFISSKHLEATLTTEYYGSLTIPKNPPPNVSSFEYIPVSNLYSPNYIYSISFVCSTYGNSVDTASANLKVIKVSYNGNESIHTTLLNQLIDTSISEPVFFPNQSRSSNTLMLPYDNANPFNDHILFQVGNITGPLNAINYSITLIKSIL